MTAYGQKSNIGINFQNSFGTNLVTSLYWLPHISDGLGLNIEQLVSEAMRGIHDEGDSYTGMKTIDGELEIEAQPIPLGVLFKAIFGDPSTVNSGGIYTHTFKPRTSDFDGLSANNPFTYHQYLDTGSSNLLYDLNATMLELSVAAGEFMKAKLGVVGGSFIQSANVATSYPTGKRFTWDQTSVSIGGAGNSKLIDLTMSFNESLEAQHTMNGSKYPSRIKRTGFRTIEVSGTIKFDDQDEYQDFLAQTEQNMTVNFKGATEIQSGYYDEVTVILPLLRYSEVKPMAGGVGPIEVGITGMGKYSVDSATSAAVILVNTQAAY